MQYPMFIDQRIGEGGRFRQKHHMSPSHDNSWPYAAPLLASADGAALASVGGGDAVAGVGGVFAPLVSPSSPPDLLSWGEPPASLARFPAKACCGTWLATVRRVKRTSRGAPSPARLLAESMSAFSALRSNGYRGSRNGPPDVLYSRPFVRSQAAQV